MLEHELAWGNAGNLSLRIAPERYLITASGTRLGELEADDLGDLVEYRLSGRGKLGPYTIPLGLT